MIRALSLSCLAVLLIGLGAAPVFAKPAIAVLGLEVIDPNGTPTAQDTQIAKELTDGLRARAKVGTGQYQLAPGSDKELIDQKLLNNCDSEAPSCMSAIGNQLGAEVLMYGRLQKEGRAYQVTLKILDVARKSVLKSSSDLIPLAETQGAPLQGWARKIYAKLTGEASSGSVVVKLQNGDRGTILINGEERGNITAGTGTVTGLPEGKYKVAVEADGFRRWDRDVTVTAGRTSTIPVELERGGGPDFGSGPGAGGSGGGDEGGSGKGLWKGLFVGGLVTAAAGGGWWIYNYTVIEEEKQWLCDNGGYKDRPGCSNISLSASDLKTHNDRGEDAKRQTFIGGAVVGVGVAVAAFAFYKGFISKDPSTTERNASKGRGKRVRRDRFVVTPIVSPDGGGATVRIDW